MFLVGHHSLRVPLHRTLLTGALDRLLTQQALDFEIKQPWEVSCEQWPFPKLL